MANQQVTQCMVWGRGEDGSLPCQIVNTGNQNLHGSVSLKAVSQVACGGKHSIVVTANGELYTWGWNWHGQLGHGDMRDLLLAQPVRTLALVRALTQTFTVAVAAGKEHSIALTNTGAVYSWGGGREGQLGSGEEEISQPVPRLITKFYAVRVAMVCASGDHSLALAEGGVVHSWGKGANGTLGHGDVLNYPSPTVVKALIGLHVTMIACGWSHSLAVCTKTSETSTLYTWGKGDCGQLGLGDRLDRLLPTEICLESDLRSSDDAAIRTITSFQPGKILAVAAGYFHTGLIVTSPIGSEVPTRVYTWGWGEHGQLGHGTREDEVLPRVVTALQTLHVTQMACGGGHSMVITHNLECYGFGNAEFGQLGFMKEEEEVVGADEHDLNSTSIIDELNIMTGSDKLCIYPTQVHIEGYKVMRVACGWWHTVAIVLNCTNTILSPPPRALFSGSDVSPLTERESSERDSEQNEERSDDEVPSPQRFNLLSKLRGTFGSTRSDKETLNSIATEEWTYILANWASSRTSKRTRTLWRCGIPPNIRKEVWTRALGVGPSSQFEEILQSIQTNRAARLSSDDVSSETARLISLDVPRTYPTLAMFQQDCSLNQALQDVLEAVASINPDLGYCQGMSYLASTLLMYMDTNMSFTVMTVLTSHPLLSALFAMNVPMVVQHMRIFEYLFAKRLPKVFENFRNLGITSDQYAMEWLMTLFSRALPLEISHRLWDCFIMEGEMFLYRAVVGLLKMDKQVLESGTFEQCLALVKTFKEFDADLLFKKIFAVRVPKYLKSMADRLS